MSKKILRNAIKSRLTAEVTKLKTVRTWNNQIDNEDRENAFGYPATFVGFSEITWQEQLNGIQIGEVLTTIYICFERYADETIIDTIDDTLIAVYAALQLYDGDDLPEADRLFSPLNRVAERVDDDHDNVIVHQMDFLCSLIDCTGSTTNDKIIWPFPHNLEITPREIVTTLDP